MAIFKTHVSLNVTNLKKSVDFYQAMFGISPVKYKSDYAKFDVVNPPLNLTLQLNLNFQSNGTLSHLGVQVETTDDVKAAIERFREAGLDVFEEENTDCCYALQDKVWVKDPDNNSWEVFVVKIADTAPEEEKKNKQVTPCCVK